MFLGRGRILVGAPGRVNGRADRRSNVGLAALHDFALEARAQKVLATGYQRLLTFEVGNRSGTSSLYGQAPASTWLRNAS